MKCCFSHWDLKIVSQGLSSALTNLKMYKRSIQKGLTQGSHYVLWHVIVIEFIIVSNELVQTLIYHHNVTSKWIGCLQWVACGWVDKWDAMHQQSWSVIVLTKIIIVLWRCKHTFGLELHFWRLFMLCLVTVQSCYTPLECAVSSLTDLVHKMVQRI